MLNVKVNGERAGRVEKPARSIEVRDPRNGALICTFSFGQYGWGESIQNEISVSMEEDTEARFTVRLDNKARPEIIGSYRDGGGWWRWDPRKTREEGAELLRATVEKLTGTPVEIIQVEKRIEIADPEERRIWER